MWCAGVAVGENSYNSFEYSNEPTNSIEHEWHEYRPNENKTLFFVILFFVVCEWMSFVGFISDGCSVDKQLNWNYSNEIACEK